MLVYINTYNRNKELLKVVAALFDSAIRYNKAWLTVLIHNDGGEPVSKTILGLGKDMEREDVGGIIGTYSATNGGKAQYWNTVKQCWDYINRLFPDEHYYFMLPDDAVIPEDFFSESIRIWEGLPPGKISLELTHRDRVRNWTGFDRVHLPDMGVNMTQYLDLSMMGELELFQTEIQPINPNRWKKDPTLSSGVGRQLSIMFHKAGRKMFEIDRPFVTRQNVKSQMNQWRKETKYT